MELAGYEKRIRALFFELRLEDQSFAPSFDRLWNSARTTEPKRIGFMRPLVAIGSLVIIGAACAIGLWFSYTSISASNQGIAKNSVPTVSPSVEPRTEAPKRLEMNTPVRTRRAFQRKNVRPKELAYLAIQQAAALSSWQSPTDGLMEPSGSSVLKALPEFTQTVKDLELYLSNNEVKELKK
jgi:hypothetical protein